jgi:hypothetical protein
MLTVYIGWDERDIDAYAVAAMTLRRNSSIPLNIKPLKDWELRAQGVYYRSYKVDRTGQLWDENDGTPFSTKFSFTRFCVPKLEDYSDEWVLFMDADMLIRGDIADVYNTLDASMGVYCVQHKHEPDEGVKMDGVMQSKYSRKNWSSFMFIKPSKCRGLTPYMVNNKTGQWLHGMLWIDDRLIGDLPIEWNWLAGYSEPCDPKNVHFTLGTPNMSHYIQTDYDLEWWNALEQSKDNSYAEKEYSPG